jgi:hypothetical protein
MVVARPVLNRRAARDPAYAEADRPVTLVDTDPVTNFATRILCAVFDRLFPGPDEKALLDPKQREIRAFAYEQADLVRADRLTREQALAAISARFPELSPEQVKDALARGWFESR